MVVDFGVLGNNAGYLISLFIVVGMMYKGFKKANSISVRLDKHEECINESLEERKILMRAQKATLEAVSGIQCNGNVRSSIKEINDYLVEEVHERIKKQGE